MVRKRINGIAAEIRCKGVERKINVGSGSPFSQRKHRLADAMQF